MLIHVAIVTFTCTVTPSMRTKVVIVVQPALKTYDVACFTNKSYIWCVITRCTSAKVTNAE